MPRQRYFVDWRDPAFPEILPIGQGSGYVTPLTFGEAKREIVEHFEALRDHAKDQISKTRKLRVENVGQEL